MTTRHTRGFDWTHAVRELRAGRTVRRPTRTAGQWRTLSASHNGPVMLDDLLSESWEVVDG